MKFAKDSRHECSINVLQVKGVTRPLTGEARGAADRRSAGRGAWGADTRSSSWVRVCCKQLMPSGMPPHALTAALKQIVLLASICYQWCVAASWCVVAAVACCKGAHVCGCAAVCARAQRRTIGNGCLSWRWSAGALSQQHSIQRCAGARVRQPAAWCGGSHAWRVLSKCFTRAAAWWQGREQLVAGWCLLPAKQLPLLHPPGTYECRVVPCRAMLCRTAFW